MTFVVIALAWLFAALLVGVLVGKIIDLSEEKTMPNQVAMQKWVEALRSGDFQQGYRTLNRWKAMSEAPGDKSDFDAVGLCCLGVLCEVAVKEGIIAAGVQGKAGMTTYGDISTAFPPPEVIEWAGLEFNNPIVSVVRQYPGEEGTYTTSARLSDLNDEEKVTFAEIADLVEDQFIAKSDAGQPA